MVIFTLLVEVKSAPMRNPIDFLIDVIQEYDHSKHGVQVLADFNRTSMKPPLLTDEEMSILTILIIQRIKFTPSRQRTNHKMPHSMT